VGRLWEEGSKGLEDLLNLLENLVKKPRRRRHWDLILVPKNPFGTQVRRILRWVFWWDNILYGRIGFQGVVGLGKQRCWR